MMFVKQEIIKEMRTQYPVGCRVELIRMNDKFAPPIATKGTVAGVDDIGSLMVAWDNGSFLNVLYGEDYAKRIDEVNADLDVLGSV